MPAITAGVAALAAGAGLASGLINTGANIWSQKDQQAFNSEEALKQREFSAAEAQKQREFEERMSNTAYQRARADMEAAGLNPASIGMTGSASTPSSSIPSAYAANSSSGRVGAMNSSYFGSLFSSAVNAELRENKGFREEVFKNMKATSAREIAQLEDALYKVTKNPIYDKNGGFTIL